MRAHFHQPPTTGRLLAFWALLLLVALRAVMPSAFMPTADTGRDGVITLAMCLSGSSGDTLATRAAPAEFKALAGAAEKAPATSHHDGAFCDFCACPSAASLAHTLMFDALAPPLSATPLPPFQDAPRHLPLYRAAARAPPVFA